MSRYAMEPKIVVAKHAAEAGGHWYTRDGKMVESVADATGTKQISPDLRHAKKHLFCPGVTTIIRCAAAPGLVQWQVYQGILAALTLPKRPHEPEAEYLRRVYDDSKEQAKAAAEEGTRIHAAIEMALDTRPGPSFDPAYYEHVVGAKAELKKYFGAAEWATEVSFAHPLGYGSKIDLFGNSGAIIVDTKSKDMGPDNVPTPQNRKRLHYDEMAMQLAAYRHAKGNADSVCANLFVSRTHPGLSYLHVWAKEEIDRAWEMFLALHRYWSLKNNYQPGWVA